MFRWTPETVRQALDRRDAGELRELARVLIAAIKEGRAHLLRKRPWLDASSTTKEDDVNEVMLELFARRDHVDAYLLRKFGDHPTYRPSERALTNYVIGVTFFTLLRRYQKRRLAWEEIRVELANSEDDRDFFRGVARYVRAIDLERALEQLAAAEWGLFHMLFVEQVETRETCRRLGINADALHQRKSRLIKRLRELLTEMGPTRRDDHD